jgi:hypothetical protein
MERACVRGSSLPTATSSGSNSARLATRSSAGDSVMAVSYPAGFYPVPNGSLLRPRGTSAVAGACGDQRFRAKHEGYPTTVPGPPGRTFHVAL